MSVRLFTLCFLVIGALGAARGGAPERTTHPNVAASHPNVFLITIDTLRADHVHCYGYQPIQTPALDSLAKDGIRFTQAFTPSPIGQ